MELNALILDGNGKQALELAVQNKQWLYATIISQTIFNSSEPAKQLAKSLTGISSSHRITC